MSCRHCWAEPPGRCLGRSLDRAKCESPPPLNPREKRPVVATPVAGAAEAPGGKLLYRLKKSTRYYRDNREDFIKDEGDEPQQEIPYLLSCLHYRYCQLHRWWHHLQSTTRKSLQDQKRKEGLAGPRLPPRIARVVEKREEADPYDLVYAGMQTAHAMSLWGQVAAESSYRQAQLAHGLTFYSHHKRMLSLG